MTSETASGLAPLFIFLAILLFAALAWCMISSCLGQSIGQAASELWRTLVMSARSGQHNAPWRRQRDWADGEFEMESRGRGRI